MKLPAHIAAHTHTHLCCPTPPDTVNPQAVDEEEGNGDRDKSSDGALSPASSVGSPSASRGPTLSQIITGVLDTNKCKDVTNKRAQSMQRCLCTLVFSSLNYKCCVLASAYRYVCSYCKYVIACLPSLQPPAVAKPFKCICVVHDMFDLHDMLDLASGTLMCIA